MKNKDNLFLQISAVIADAGSIMLGAWLAYLVRFSETVTQHIPIVTGLPPVGWYLWLSMVMAALVVFFMITGRMYLFPRTDGLFDELTLTWQRFILTYLVVLAGLFFIREITFSRLTLTILFFFSGFSLVGSRYLGRMIREKLYARSFAVRRAALVGEGSQLPQVLAHLQTKPQFGIQVIGSISREQAATTGETITPYLGTIAEAGKLVRDNQINTIIIAPGQKESDILPELVKACYGVNVDFLYLPEIQLSNGRPKRIVEVGGTPLWTLKEVPFEGWNGLIKRAFDVILSLLLMVLLLPLLAVIALAIKLGSKGPLFYKQRRIGLNNQEFKVIKFRSMRVDAEVKTGAVWATAHDPRVTRVGRFIRRWSLDELPQLWNVLRGDMSLVGPRPERPEFVCQFEQEVDGYQERHRVRSGLTGWAQVNGLRGDVPIAERTRFDRDYVENWSLLLDLKILLLTINAVIKGENAY